MLQWDVEDYNNTFETGVAIHPSPQAGHSTAFISFHPDTAQLFLA